MPTTITSTSILSILAVWMSGLRIQYTNKYGTKRHDASFGQIVGSSVKRVTGANVQSSYEENWEQHKGLSFHYIVFCLSSWAKQIKALHC